MKIKAYKSISTESYFITIGNSVYEMNNEANKPNGLNLYCGKKSEIEKFNRDIFKNEVLLIDLPKIILYSILLRVANY